MEDELKTINKKYEFPACYKKATIHKNSISFGYNAPKIKKVKKYISQVPNEEEDTF